MLLDIEQIRQHKRDLPIFSGRRELVREIQANECTVVISETGSGKTTQLPQYLLESGLARTGVIACTQPRRVAAIKVAERVSTERQVALGALVGYTVRFEDKTSDLTKIKFMTDGMLLRESLLDASLAKYAVIILDEAHERTIHTDVLFGVVKQAQQNRKVGNLSPLKIVIMSATLQAERFSAFFNGAKICFLEGRRHPIKIQYTEEVQTDYIHAALITALQIHQELPLGGDILVFLTGQEEIEGLTRLIRDCVSGLPSEQQVVQVCSLFAALPQTEMAKAFHPTPPGHRKIILATNIAETSLTIPGVKYVVDTGVVKVKEYNPTTGLEMLYVRAISKAQARQRSGRAGRESAGVCYRLYTEDTFHDVLVEDAVPEIQRCDLSSVVLQLLTLGIRDVMSFDFMDAPSHDALREAVTRLRLLGAVSDDEPPVLTEHGRTMSAFPLEPMLTQCILSANQLGCLEEMISIVSLLSVESIVYAPAAKRELARKVHEKFVASEGDPLTLLNQWRAYRQNAKRNVEWSREHFINVRAVRRVNQIRTQLRDLAINRLHFTSSSCGKDTSRVCRALASGLFMNCAERQRDGTYVTVATREPVTIHPTSVLFRAKPACVVYAELVKTSRCYIRGLCVVDPSWLVAAAPNFFKNHRLVPEAVAS